MISHLYPEPCVGALVVNKEGEILLVKSYKWRNNYVMPGGHVEIGETLVTALKREIKEETGLEVNDIKFLMMMEFIFDKNFYKKRHFIFFDYTCQCTSKKVKLDDEGQEYLWIKPDKVLSLPIEPYTKKAIKEYLNKNDCC